MKALRDKTGRKIMIGDILKVFHFTRSRWKRYFMYKQVIGVETLGKANPHSYLKISHLDMTDSYYNELLDGRILEDYEIVQGVGKDHFEDRKRDLESSTQDSIPSQENAA